MKHLILIFSNLCIFICYSQNKTTHVQYTVYYNFSKPLQRDIDLFINDFQSIYIEKINTTKYIKKDNDYNKIKLPETSEFDSHKLIIQEINWDNIFIKIDVQNDLLFTTEQNPTLGNYIVEEKRPIIKWKILNERKKINNLICIKAIAKFRGLDWEIWFTNDITLPYGPWKLQGAPGLIIEAKNKQETIHYVLNKVNYNVEPHQFKLPDFKSIGLRDYIALIDEDANYEYYEDRDTKVSKKSNPRSVKEPIYEWEEQNKNN